MKKYGGKNNPFFKYSFFFFHMPAIQYHLGVVPKLEKKEREKND